MADHRGHRRKDRQGSAAIEFALVGPMLVLLLARMVVYGGWFWLAQSVQSLAAESARAAMTGLDDAERRQLAMAFVTQQAAQGSDLNRVTLADNGSRPTRWRLPGAASSG